MASIKTTQLNGDVSVGRNVAMGGKSTIAGSVTIGHDLIVKGWLEAPNVKGANKGIFQTMAKLKAAYPEPEDGWFAGVGTSSPFAAYTAKDGVWTATGGTIDINVDLTHYSEEDEKLAQDIAAVESNLSVHIKDTNNPHSVTASQTGAYTKEEIDTKISGISSDLNKIETIAFNHTNSTSNPHGVTAAQVGAYTTAQTDTAISTAKSDLQSKIDEKENALTTVVENHVEDIENPHGVTAAQVGAYTTAQTDTAISTAKSDLQSKIDEKENALTTVVENHVEDIENPHGVTAAQVGAYTKSEVDDMQTTNQSLFNFTQEQISALQNNVSSLQDASATHATKAGGKIVTISGVDFWTNEIYTTEADTSTWQVGMIFMSESADFIGRFVESYTDDDGVVWYAGEGMTDKKKSVLFKCGEGVEVDVSDAAVDITIDDGLCETSSNPVQNSYVTKAINGKVDKVAGKGLSANDYTDAEQEKLASIEAGANKYVLPTASDTNLGGVIVGSGLTIDDDGALSVTSSAMLDSIDDDTINDLD